MENERLILTEEWDKTFPKSDKVNHIPQQVFKRRLEYDLCTFIHEYAYSCI